MDILTNVAHTYPLMRGGAILFILVGLGIIVGGLGGRRWLLPSLITGAILAVGTMMILSITKIIFIGLGQPAVYQWVVMGIGFAVEFGLVNYVVFTIPDRTSRRFWLWMLFVVGAHFLIFTFSHGPLAGLLGLLCMANALVGLRLENIDYRIFWVADGCMKLGVGIWMLLLTI
jgi:hypothetical protein